MDCIPVADEFKGRAFCTDSTDRIIEWSKVIAPVLVASKLLAKMFIDLFEIMSILLCC